MKRSSFQALGKFDPDAYDIDDPKLQEVEGDENDERVVLQFLHHDYHEYQQKKRKWQEMEGPKSGKVEGSEDEDGDDDEEEEEEDDDDDEEEEEEEEDLADISKFELTKLLMSKMDARQNDRYDTFRRTTINKTGIKKLTNQIFANPLPQDLIVMMSSISKMLVGEVVEKAKDVQLKYEKKRLVEQNLLKKAKISKDGKSDVAVKVLDLDKSPLRPEHIREAWRLYQMENKHITPNDSYRKQGGNGDGMLFR